MVVIHYTAMRSAKAAIQRLCDPQAQVSAHYVICRTGEITQLVPEEQRAWHAGEGEWNGQADVNSRSIGIELDNSGTHPFPEPQMATLEVLLQGLLARWPIKAEDVIGHSDMAPGRKFDPGARFDWARLAHRGFAAPTIPGRACVPDAQAFREAVAAMGFTTSCDDDVLLHAFRLRHRQGACGPLDADDMALALGRGAKLST